MTNSTVQGSAKPKGKPRGASRAGIPNKATKDAREAIASFVDGNAHRLTGWLDDVANGVKSEEGKWVVAPNPEKAFTMFQSVIEYHVPKLARQEQAISGELTIKKYGWEE